MPSVTAALAVYDGAATLAEAIRSAQGQTRPPDELLVLDDGSRDGSSEIARSLGARVLVQANAGLGEGRRRLTEEARGEWIAFLDHDDVWMPDRLERGLALVDDETVLVHAEATFVYEDGREEGRRERFDGSGFRHVLPNNRVVASTALYRRETMLQAGNFTGDTVRCSDWYGWMLLASRGEFRHVAEPLARYRVLSRSLANAGFRFHDARRHVIESHFLAEFDRFVPSGAPERERYRGMLRRELALAYSGMARTAPPGEGRRYARRALRTAPTVPKVLTRSLGVLLRGG